MRQRERDRQRETETETQRDTERHRERERERETDRQTDRQRETETERERGRTETKIIIRIFSHFPVTFKTFTKVRGCLFPFKNKTHAEITSGPTEDFSKGSLELIILWGWL